MGEVKTVGFRCDAGVALLASRVAESQGLRLSAVLRALLEAYAEGLVNVDRVRVSRPVSEGSER